ncbi:MAG: beta-ketoacyl-[acyl-carrier-protein] synthase family protein [Bacteroidales bacterium]|nr:beta-ketoacyl-[acyl-carrier-protein] synthase family protein [Bacteroidales bacterium]
MSVAVTGIGCVSGLGCGAEEHLQAFRAGRSGLGEVTLFQTTLQLPVAEVKRSNEQLKNHLGLDPDRLFSRTALLGMVASRQAFQDAGFPNEGLRIGLISSSSVGGMDLSEQFYAEYAVNQRKGRLRMVAHHDIGDHTERIADYLHLEGFRTSVSTACSSSANAIMLGARMIEQGLLDAVLAGGVDALCRFTLNGFNSLMILDSAPCRPFDESRAGLNLGEGAGYLVLQSEKSLTPESKVYCRLTGYANANDAYHQTASSPDGEGAFLAMRHALDKAGIDPSSVDYINLHGTGTHNNDLSESTAIKRLFGEQVPPLSSTKSFTGHTLGAAAGLEAVFSVLVLSEGVIFPTLNFKSPIKQTGLIAVTEMMEDQDITTVLSNSFGFGGNNAALIFQQ